MKIISHSVAETRMIGKAIAKNLKAGDIVLLFGELGSGKTVLTKGIALGLGIKEKEIISPTFVLLRQYLKVSPSLNHFDFYRLTRPKDILQLGYEEYFYGDAISVVEWADRLKNLLPSRFLKVELFVKSKTERLLQLEVCGEAPKDRLKKIHENIRH